MVGCAEGEMLGLKERDCLALRFALRPRYCGRVGRGKWFVGGPGRWVVFNTRTALDTARAHAVKTRVVFCVMAICYTRLANLTSE